ncbi:hypothetical protein ABL78_0670 [Leptomonas seymouri]|uniref:PH domain-containing protein n=1 Tax=Leptomonas seymouri TaxID=5684 RepID=A0A0N1I1N6_LEPSE|nr:hypothetical protein ABL78_0670 [Leptomonas seymouri]|eukprot:KPI90152.1 hypothetical protein ABL78_0670 [Leptomonas seymouri]
MPHCHGPRKSTPEPEHLPHVRFSSVLPSAPLVTFSVLKWTPASGLRAHLYLKRSTSLQRLENNASIASTEEERRDPLGRTIFEASAGTWQCFHQISCCGDVLVVEEAGAIDVGPPRRQEYTWQQGPGRLPSVDNGNMSFGGSGGWRQTLSSFSQSVMEMDADAAARGTLVSRPSHHKQEIPMRDIHSARRYVFKRPLPLTFNSNGRLIDPAQEDSHGGHSKGSHRCSSSDDLEKLKWRYELWGPVGLIFTLRGGERLFFVFASGQHAEQMEELLINFSSGRGLQLRKKPSALPLSAIAASGTPAATNTTESPAGFSAGSPLYSGAPASPAVSYASLRLGSPDISFHSALRSTSISPANSLTLADATTHVPSSANVALSSGASAISFALPSVSTRPRHSLNGTDSNMSAPHADSLATPLNAGFAPTSAVSHMKVSVPPMPPSTWYLYCRPWGDAVRYRRYYLRPAAASRSSNLVRLSRHRFLAWQKIRQALGREPRCVCIDLKRTYLTPSSTHENVFRVESVVDTYAQYKDVVPLGGAVACAESDDETPSRTIARQRESELCRFRPVIFEALAKTKEERAEWLAWLHACGASVLLPEATGALRVAGGSASKSSGPQFHPLGDQPISPSPAGHASVPQHPRGNSVDPLALSGGFPPSLMEVSAVVDHLGVQRPPQLPMKESDSERGPTSPSLRPKWPTNSLTGYPQPMKIRSSSSPKNLSKMSHSSSPDPVINAVLSQNSSSNERPRHTNDLDENSIAVEEDEWDVPLETEKAHSKHQLQQKQTESQQEDLQQDAKQPSSDHQSLKSLFKGTPALLDHTIKPVRYGVSVSQRNQGAPQAASGSALHEPVQGSSNGIHNDDADDSAAEEVIAHSPGEGGAATGYTQTASCATGVDVLPATMYLDDTSPSEREGTHHPPSSVSNSPHDIAPHLKPQSPFSSPEVCRCDADGHSVLKNRKKTSSYGFASFSPHPVETFREANAEAPVGAEPPPNHSASPRDIKDKHASVVNVGLSISDASSALRRSVTDMNSPSRVSVTDVCHSTVRGIDSTPPITPKLQATPGYSSSAEGTRAPTATPEHLRSATAATEINRDRTSSHSTPRIRLSQDLQLTSLKASPSPGTPSVAAPANALSAGLPDKLSTDTSPVGRTLFSSPERDDDGVRVRNGGDSSSKLASSVVLPCVPSASLENDSVSHNKEAVSVAVGLDEWSALKSSPGTHAFDSCPTTPERKFDPRLAKFFTPPHPSNGSRERSSGRVINRLLGNHTTSAQLNDTLGLRGENYSKGPFLGATAVKPSRLHSRLRPPPLSSFMGGLTSVSLHEIPVGSRFRAQTSLTAVADCNGCHEGDDGTSLLKGSSTRANYYDVERLSGSLPFQSRDVLEERKRAFRNSLFVNQK